LPAELVEENIQSALGERPKGVLGRFVEVLVQQGISLVSAIASASRANTAYKTTAAIRYHHSFPQYLGGRYQQILEPLPKSLHDAYHSGLDKILPRALGSAYYQGLSAAKQADVLREFRAYTQAFDEMHGTKLWDAAVREGVLEDVLLK
jgi:hypothetical protein